MLWSRRCPICGAPHSVILSAHERQHALEELAELRTIKEQGQAVVAELRSTLEAMQTILAAMPRLEHD